MSARPDGIDFTCLDFRRAKLADPKRPGAAAHAHLARCAACRGFAASVDAAERRARKVLEVPVPEGLAERVILRARTRRAAPAWRLAALAATVVLSVGVGLATWVPATREDAARSAIRHVLHEPEAFEQHRLADTREFGTVLARFGGEIRQPIGKVRYMKLCPVPGGTGWHIVIDTEYGPATLLLVPARRDGAASVVHADMKGYVAMAQAAGEGYYALVTDSRESLEAIGAMMRERVNWRI